MKRKENRYRNDMENYEHEEDDKILIPKNISSENGPKSKEGDDEP